MTNNNKSNKLVNTGNNNKSENKKGKWSDKYSRVVADTKTFSKFSKLLRKQNKALSYKDRIPQYKAVSEALKMWMEKNQ